MSIKLGLVKSVFVAEEAMNEKEGYGVTLGSKPFNVLLGGLEHDVFGVVTDNLNYAIGDTVNICTDQGAIVQLRSNDTISIGDKVNNDDNATWRVAPKGTSAFAVALQSVSSPQLFWAIIQPNSAGVTGPSGAIGATGATGYTGYTK